MAKPIRKTPTLSKKSADDFIASMLQTERRRKANKAEREFISLIGKCKT